MLPTISAIQLLFAAMTAVGAAMVIKASACSIVIVMGSVEYGSVCGE